MPEPNVSDSCPVPAPLEEGIRIDYDKYPFRRGCQVVYQAVAEYQAGCWDVLYVQHCWGFVAYVDRVGHYKETAIGQFESLGKAQAFVDEIKEEKEQWKYPG